MTKRSTMAGSKRSGKLTLQLSLASTQTLQAATTVARKFDGKLVLDSALSEAEERLADRRVFTLDRKRWDAFVAAPDAPPRRISRIERLFAEPSVFDPKNST